MDDNYDDDHDDYEVYHNDNPDDNPDDDDTEEFLDFVQDEEGEWFWDVEWECWVWVPTAVDEESVDGEQETEDEAAVEYDSDSD